MSHSDLAGYSDLGDHSGLGGHSDFIPFTIQLVLYPFYSLSDLWFHNINLTENVRNPQTSAKNPFMGI